jgi:hypothetical protein
MELFISIALSMLIIIIFCLRSDRIEYREKYGHDREYFELQKKYMRGEDFKR